MTETKKIIKQKKLTSVLPPSDVMVLVHKKADFFKDVIQKTIIHAQRCKFLDILGVSDIGSCVERLGILFKNIKDALESKNSSATPDELVNYLQVVNNDISGILKNYGTESLEDLLLICFGNNYKLDSDTPKFELLKKYFHPTGYKIVSETKSKKASEEYVDESTKHLDCFDITSAFKQFHMKVYGIKLYIHSALLKKHLIVYGIVDDVIIEYLNAVYVTTQQEDIKANLPLDLEYHSNSFDMFVASLTLKDYLLCDNYNDFYSKYAGYVSQNNSIHQKQISTIVKEFISDDVFSKRSTLIHLLIKSSNHDNQYLAYLLYDLLSNESNGVVDTQEQTILYDSLPWPLKHHFKQAMKKTIQYTNELSNFDMNKIPLEQQICLMNAPDSVKEKAMMKLKEVKAKSEDSGSKARQYLDGLLKIPFGVYKKEPILYKMDELRKQFKDFYKKYDIEKRFPNIPNKDTYTNVEIVKYLNQIQPSTVSSETIDSIKKTLMSGDRNKLTHTISQLNEILNKHNLNHYRIKNTMKKEQLKNEIEKYVDYSKNNKIVFDDTVSLIQKNSTTNYNVSAFYHNMKQVTDYMTFVETTLNECVYGHKNAKRQLERIIGQWINSSSNEKQGHVLGFEGNPGVGKTTIAKGLANCLKDDNGESRPFAFIAIGGDANSSSLVGHSYTYVGSTWGQLSQILMDKKCMNPVILLDEVDKISKTENGKELSGILTHLLDPSQNDEFQDKYFTGVPLDLSRVLFILSYNDPSAIDKILLDRVHRIKFDSLTVEDKIVIAKNHLLPEIYKKVGLENMIHFSDDTIKFIIDDYTLEPGVRKLKEKLLEIVGELNLNFWKSGIYNNSFELPIQITTDDIKTTYFKDKREIIPYKIHTESKVGVINALWANEFAMGGPLELQVSFIPASTFLELKMTGSIGDVMQQSINVSLTNAWNLTPEKRQKELIKKYNNKADNEVFGLHIHCPGISTNKDGPSATTAFTVLIYSLFNNIKIKNYVGITGETSFNYCLTEIGGLEHKIIKSIPSGIKEFIFPRENKRDFDKIMEKYKDNDIIKGIQFHCIQDINDVLDLILEK